MLYRWFGVLLAAGVLAACGASAMPEETPTLASEPCRLSISGSAQSVAARCSTLDVPENYAESSGTQITLRVVTIPAISRNPEPDGLFLIAGGPGQAASEAFTPLIAVLNGVNRTRDLVLVDQRGTGGSNPLICAIDDPLTNSSEEENEQWLRDCVEALDGDPRFYTTEAAARDLDAVRAALGYSQVNLLGVSYGTRVAQTYARLYPEQMRTMILDGVVPNDEAIGTNMDLDAQRAIERMFERCATDELCNEAFPDLAGQFTQLLAQLAEEPATVQLDDPFTGEPTEFTLNADLAAFTIQNLSYSPETVALLPLLIGMAAEGDLRPLTAQVLLLNRNVGETISLGLRLSVMCSEDVPFYGPRPEPRATYLEQRAFDVFEVPCEFWPHIPADENIREPLTLDVPTLLLSGENDPVTPPDNGDEVAAGLPNSLHIVAPGQGHSIFFRGCLPLLVADFVRDADLSLLDPSCVERLDAPPFFTSFTGPAAPRSQP